ncbi:MAG: hypothetical protein ACOC7S_01825 [Planctomycetota bacterium]
MKPRRHKATDSASIGFFALPALCCLLGAVVYLSSVAPEAVSDAGEPALLAEQSKIIAQQIEEAEAERQELFEGIAALREEVQDRKERRKQLGELKLKLARLEERIQELRATKEKLAQIVDAQKERAVKIADLKGQYEDLQRAIEQLRARVRKLQQEREQDSKRSGRTGYSGPYVLVECLEGEVVVYPGEKRLSTDASRAEKEAVLHRAERVGFVALAVRPSGYEDSYAEFRGYLNDSDAELSWSSFPIGAEEPIERYVPKGTRR